MDENEKKFMMLRIQQTQLLILEEWQLLNKMRMEALTRQEYEKRLAKIRKQVNELSDRMDDIEK